MANTGKVLYQGQLSAAGSTLYTVPSNKTALIKSIDFTNPDTSGHWYKVWIGGAADSNVIRPQTTIGAGESAQDDQLRILDTGKTIQAIADASSKVTVTITGIEADTL